MILCQVSPTSCALVNAGAAAVRDGAGAGACAGAGAGDAAEAGASGAAAPGAVCEAGARAPSRSAIDMCCFAALLGAPKAGGVGLRPWPRPLPPRFAGGSSSAAAAAFPFGAIMATHEPLPSHDKSAKKPPGWDPT